MKTCLFSFVRIYEGSMVASQRIARVLSEELSLPITTDLNIGEQPEKLDRLLIVNGAYAFSRCLPELGVLIERAKKVVWIQNDYTIIPPKADSNAESPFRKAFRNRAAAGLPHIDYWTTVEKNAKATPASHYVNWNSLTFQENIKPQKGNGKLLYYGSFREFRVKDFDRFFIAPGVPTVISSAKVKGKNRFQERYPQCSHDDKIEGDFSKYLGSHGLGLYLEDRKSHSEFHSPANRFYEMLSAGLPMVFQPEAGSMMRRGGYDPTPYQIDKSRDAARMMDKCDSIGKEQRAAWYDKAAAEYKKLPKQIHEAWRKL